MVETLKHLLTKGAVQLTGDDDLIILLIYIV